MIIGVDDRDEWRIAESAIAITCLGRGIGIGRAIDDDDRFRIDNLRGVDRRILRGRLRAEREQQAYGSGSLHSSPHVTAG